MTDDRFIWCDVETFGLNPLTDPLIEVGFTITDLDFNFIDSTSVLIWDGAAYDARLVRLKDDAGLGDPDADFVLKMHSKSNLWDIARDQGVLRLDAEKELEGWLHEHDVDSSTQEPLCGSTVQFDRAMLAEQMPSVIERFHYRNIDISSVKELCKRLNREMYSHISEDVSSRMLHRALPDLEDTIAEAKWYADNFLFTYTEQD